MPKTDLLVVGVGGDDVGCGAVVEETLAGKLVVVTSLEILT